LFIQPRDSSNKLKIIYHSFGTGLYDAIYTIYGKSIVDNIFEMQFERGDFKFSGFLGKPTFSKPNRTYQTLIINGRYVINQSIATAINRAFENFMMKGSFPFFVLNLSIPLDKVDVNVHPNKLEVKFEDNNSIFGMVYSEVLNILYNQMTTKKISSEDEEIVDTSKLAVLENIGSKYEEQNNNNSENDEIKEVSLTDNVEYERNKIDKELDEFKKNVENSEMEKSGILPLISDSAFEFKIQQNKPNSTNLMDSDNNQKSEDTISFEIKQENILESTEDVNREILLSDEDYKIIGTIFNTYIIVENDNSMLIIDQHAGHERLLFDKFNAELNTKSVAIQPLIVPFVLETNYNESNFINDNLEVLASMGFDIEEFGENSFKISSVPMLFDNIDLDKFFNNILSDINNKLLISKNDTIKEYIAKKACRSAVKANDKLSKNEVNELIKQINQPGQVLLCPHGRPIVVDVDKKEIEKWFKRIV